MTKEIAKKTIILYILEMLEKGSSKEKPITITNITKVLNSMGVSCERRTVGRNINYLIEYGKPIVKIKGGGCYINRKLIGYLHSIHKDDDIRFVHDKVEVISVNNNIITIKKANGESLFLDAKDSLKNGIFTTEDIGLINLLRKKGLY